MDEKHPELTADHIIDAVLDGFKEGETNYGVKVKLTDYLTHDSQNWFHQMPTNRMLAGLIPVLLAPRERSNPF